MVSMSSLSGWTVLCGLVLGVGLWILTGMLPRMNRPRLVHRVAPYVLDVSAGARELVSRRPAVPLPVIGAVFAPYFLLARNLLGDVLGGSRTVRVRLRQAGSASTVQAFRSQQLIWTMCGGGAGLLLSMLWAGLHSISFPVGVVVIAVGAVGALICCDYRLQWNARRRLRQITAELPALLEFLTLSLSAGEGILDAVRRIARVSHGQLPSELAAVVSMVGSGLPFADSLNGMAAALQSSAVSRCTEQIVGALERGTPLAEVLRAQAQDAREDAKRTMLETAGRKEVAMMVPLVFLILPITIAYAVFPGIFVLQLGL